MRKEDHRGKEKPLSSLSPKDGYEVRGGRNPPENEKKKGENTNKTKPNKPNNQTESKAGQEKTRCRKPTWAWVPTAAGNFSTLSVTSLLCWGHVGGVHPAVIVSLPPGATRNEYQHVL